MPTSAEVDTRGDGFDMYVVIEVRLSDEPLDVAIPTDGVVDLEDRTGPARDS